MEHAITIRLLSFVLIFVLLAFWEIAKPRRTLTTSKKIRWFNNLSIVAINPFVVRLVFPVLTVGMAQTAQDNGWGLLTYFAYPNFGFNLSAWDRLFGTYLDQPQKGHTDMVIGLSQLREEMKLTFFWLLILPMIGNPGRQPINRH